MLTRLEVSGFKNLVNVDVRFGPFTCIVGRNGAGKSNLFDAIRFLGALANQTLMEAAASVRDQDSRSVDVRNLFHRVGGRYADHMSFSAEMIVPQRAIDDLGQEAKASITFLKYTLELAYKETGDNLTAGGLEITKEELRHITKGTAPQHLLFPHKKSDWRDTVIRGRRSAGAFISTDDEAGQRIIKLHQDGGSRGRPLARPAAKLPRTVLLRGQRRGESNRCGCPPRDGIVANTAIRTVRASEIRRFRRPCPTRNGRQAPPGNSLSSSPQRGSGTQRLGQHTG